MLDLKNNKYDLTILKENIYALSLIEILETQHLTSDFVLKYILNPKYQLTSEEENISLIHVFLHQPHLINTSLLDDYIQGIKKVDSFEDFESFSNRK
jgi:hypothetical protein